MLRQMNDQRNLMTDQQYLPHMPKLTDLFRMKDFEVLTWLVRIPFSLYADVRIQDIEGDITENEARRYLNELIVLNQINKSKLSDISERNQDEVSSQQSIANCGSELPRITRPETVQMFSNSVNIYQSRPRALSIEERSRLFISPQIVRESSSNRPPTRAMTG